MLGESCLGGSTRVFGESVIAMEEALVARVPPPVVRELLAAAPPMGASGLAPLPAHPPEPAPLIDSLLFRPRPGPSPGELDSNGPTRPAKQLTAGT